MHGPHAADGKGTVRVEVIAIFVGSLAIIAAPLLFIRYERVVKEDRQVLNGILTTYKIKRRNLLREWLRGALSRRLSRKA